MSFRPAKALGLLQQASDNKRLAHAYLITGPVGSGKEKLAIDLIELVNAASIRITAESLDDLKSGTTTVIGPESKSRRITIDSVRAAEHVLKMAAPDGVTKFVVIKDADRMGAGAENAFLKTLEEPPDSSMVLLLSSYPEMLLDTILSRCIKISLVGKSGPANLSEHVRSLLEALRDYTMSGKKSVSGALGLMGRFSSILKEEKAAIAERNNFAYKGEVSRYQKATEGDYLKRRDADYKALTEAEYLEQRNRLIEFLMMWFGDALRQQSGATHLDLPDFADATKKMAGQYSIDELSSKVEAIDGLRANLNTNVLEGLALEVGFIRAFS